MRAFASSTYRLRDVRADVRLVYTGFLLLVCVGMLTMAVFQFFHVGPTPTRIAAYYLGGEGRDEMTFAKTFRQLVEVTHFHAFIMGVVYLVLAHLLLATGIGARAKRGFVIAGFAGLLGDLVCPWLIRYGSAGFAYAQLAAWAAEWVGVGAFVVVPLVEMWFSHAPDEIPPE